jgi:hypothetical protein
VYQSGLIYSIGGLDVDEGVLNSVEAFDTRSLQAHPVQSCEHATFAHSCCSFGYNQIFKIGGFNAEN